MRTARLILGGLLAASLVAGTLACRSARREQPAGPLQPSSRPYESDIPIPAGFSLKEQSSEDWQAGPLRYIRHTYTGRADKYAVRQFYRDYMPRLRWSLHSDSATAGRYSMLLARGEESCQVVIEDAPAAADGVILIEVKIAPGDRRNTLKSGQ